MIYTSVLNRNRFLRKIRYCEKFLSVPLVINHRTYTLVFRLDRSESQMNFNTAHNNFIVRQRHYV